MLTSRLRADCRILVLCPLLVAGAACGSTPAAPENAAGTTASADSSATEPSKTASPPAAGSRSSTGTPVNTGMRVMAGTTGASVAGAGGMIAAGGTAASEPAAGSGGASAGVAAADGSGGAAAGSGAEAGSGSVVPTGTTGTLPPIDDPAKPGRFTVVWEEGKGPGGNYTTITPKELAQSELKHPILIWGPGAGAYPEIYKSLLDHIASHGFVIVSYNSTPQGPELNEAIDWTLEESKRDGSPFFEKLDTTKIAMGGQSAGSLATFQAGGDDRLTTTLHINGGTFDGNVSNLKKPALFICGDDPAVSGGDGTWESDLARPNCDRDFETIKIPVWYGVVVGSSHTTVIDNAMSGMPAGTPAEKLAYLAADVAWLRWQLAGDETMKALFVGADCGYCKDKTTWLVKQKDLK